MSQRKPTSSSLARDVDGISAHILPTAATMIGVCLTALYISMLSPAGTQRTMLDKILAIDAFVFLISAAVSFMSIRVRARRDRYEAHAEAIFLCGLALLAMSALVLAFMVN